MDFFLRRKYILPPTQRKSADSSSSHSASHGAGGAGHHPHGDHAEEQEETETRRGTHLYAQQPSPESRGQLSTGELPSRGVSDAALRHDGVAGQTEEEQGEVGGKVETE